MSFLNNEQKVKKAPVKSNRGGYIPIESMNKAGCSVCPRDRNTKLKNPKMLPEGPANPEIYLLGSQPTFEEDSSGRLFDSAEGAEVLRKVSSGWRDDLRLGNMVQCAGDFDSGTHKPVMDVKEIECCRGRVISDIEQSKPLVVVGVGDDVLHWATGLNRNALNFRGTLIATRFGNHDCWFYPVLTPNYVRSKSRRMSEYETTLRHDLRYIEDEIADGLSRPTVYKSPYDAGIELITGQESGDLQRLEEAFQWLLTLPSFGMDYETNEIKPHRIKDPKIWTAALGTFERTIAFCIDHRDGWGTETRIRKVHGMMGEFLRQSRRKVCHNLAFEMDWTSAIYGPELLRRTEWEDTMAMCYALDSREGTKSLDVQCRINFGFFLKDQSPVDVSVPGWIERHSVKAVLRYNALDAKWTDKLALVKLTQLQFQPDQRQVYERLMETAPTLVQITGRGLPVDMGYAEDMIAKTAPRLQEIEDKVRNSREVRLYTSQFGTFSLTNPVHVLSLMKDVLKRPEVQVVDWTGKVSYSTGEEQLEQIPANEVPSAPLILEHRGLTRNESTYLLPLLKGELTSVDGMIHEEYNQMKTATSRLSSRIHNWPKRKYREVRGVVAPPGDQWVVAADQGQIEFRVAGMLSRDENLVKYCWTGYDVHAYWAARMVKEYPRIKDIVAAIFQIDWDEKGMKTLRQEAKNGWVFPQLFGSTTQSCAARLHLPEDIAEDLGREFWDEFRGVKRWQEKTIEFYNKHLYVETLGGFRRRGPVTVNELINMPIQGTAYEVVRGGMNALSELADATGDPELQPAFNGHDDLTFIMHDDSLESKIPIIAREMCMPRFDYVNVPLIVEIGIGPRWHQVEEIAKVSSVDVFNLVNPYA